MMQKDVNKTFLLTKYSRWEKFEFEFRSSAMQLALHLEGMSLGIDT